MLKSKLENYILEQIIILEQKEDLNESKRALIGLGILGMLGAFIAKGNTPVKTKSSSSVEQTVDDAYRKQTGSRLTSYQRDQIKKGKELAAKLTQKEVNDIVEEDPGVGDAFYKLFQASDLEIRKAKMNPDNKDVPIASIEDINIDDIFIYTQQELDNYLRNEKNRSILSLQDGTNILDLTNEELNNELSDPTSEVVKVIAEELLTSKLVQHEVIKAVSDAFINTYDNYERRLVIEEIKAGHNAEMLRVNALRHWLDNNVKNEDALRTLKDLEAAGGSVGSQEEIENWIELYNSGEMPNERTGMFDDDDELQDEARPKRRVGSYEDNQEIIDFFN